MSLTKSILAIILSTWDYCLSQRDVNEDNAMDVKYAFWNNKGGTGKTSLAFQSIIRYAEKFPNKRVLAIDICPQANLSELMLGGLNNKGSEKLLGRHGLVPRCSLGGYFQLRLPSPYAPPAFNAHDFITTPIQHNRGMARNI